MKVDRAGAKLLPDTSNCAGVRNKTIAKKKKGKYFVE